VTPGGRADCPGGRVADWLAVLNLDLLASDRSANVTGADIRIDGGLITTL
jgi:hypothetical protein